MTRALSAPLDAAVAARSAGRREVVNKKWPITLTPKCGSKPSAVGRWAVVATPLRRGQEKEHHAQNGVLTRCCRAHAARAPSCSRVSLTCRRR
jgi:hypothetical protein